VKKVPTRFTALFAALVLVSLSGVAAAQESWTARAETRSTDGKLLTAPVAVTVDRLLTVAERDAVIDAFKKGGQEAARKMLAGMKEIGFVEAGGKRTPIKFAFARDMGSGRLLNIACDQAIGYIGGNIPNAKPKGGFDVAWATLILDESGNGNGEIVPAAKLKIREDVAMTTEDYAGGTVWLKDITKK